MMCTRKLDKGCRHRTLLINWVNLIIKIQKDEGHQPKVQNNVKNKNENAYTYKKPSKSTPTHFIQDNAI